MNSVADKPANIATATALIERAIAADRPDWVALPECFDFLGGRRDDKMAAAEVLGEGPAYAAMRRLAAKYGIILIAPDTSQRAKRYPGDADKYDFGIAAGFYVDATQAPWSDGYQMGTYVGHELPDLAVEHFPIDAQKIGIFGHSMGGHGALVHGLRQPERFKSVSAFAPIVAPSSCPWGEKALGNYLGPDKASWQAWDATELVKAGKRTSHILIDQGTADQFLEGELHPHLFEAACKDAGQALNLRMQEGYDHSYYFMQSFMEDHFTHHAKVLGL